MTIGLLLGFLANVLIVWLLSMDGQPTLRRVLVLPDPISQLLGPLSSWEHTALGMVLNPSPDLGLTAQMLLWRSTESSLDFLSELWDPTYTYLYLLNMWIYSIFKLQREKRVLWYELKSFSSVCAIF